MARGGIASSGCTLESAGRWEDGKLLVGSRLSQGLEEFVWLLPVSPGIRWAAAGLLPGWAVLHTVYLCTFPVKKAFISGLLMAVSHSSP